MKKILLIFIILAVAATFTVSASAIGVAFSLNSLESATGDLAITGKLSQFPPVLGLSFSLGSEATRVGLTADWWMYHKPLVGIISLYVGPGAYVNIAGNGDTTNLNLGARVPFGFQIFPFGADPELEIFVEIAPRLGLLIQDPITMDYGIQGAIGGRLWF